MISYYAYGRGKDGYVNYNPHYAKADEDTFFSKMADYAPCTKDARDMPEKLFCYRIRSQQNGECAIVGQTSLVKGMSTKLSGDRDTVFSFQYLFSGREEARLWERPLCISGLTPFPVCMDQICNLATGSIDLPSSGMVKGEDVFRAEGQSAPSDGYQTQELLDAFAMDGERLEDFLYALLLFHTDEKLYLMLPENTKAYTQMAFALMQRVLAFLPECVAKRTGFVTYVHKAATAFADYVPYEVRCMFLANTEENAAACRQTKHAFVFCKGCDTGVQVPRELKPLVAELAEAFRTEALTQLVQDFWAALERYLKKEARVPISNVEYATLYRFCILRRAVRQEGWQPNEREVWDTVDVLRSMGKERTQIWNPQLAEDTAAFVTEFIDNDWPDGADDYARLIWEYEHSDRQKAAIESFFCRQVEAHGHLEDYLRKLAPCEELQKRVSKQCEKMFLERLSQGNVDDAVLPAVISLYYEEPDKREIVCDFFTRQIVDQATLEKYGNEILQNGKHADGGAALWNDVERAVYADETKLDFLADVESQYLGKCLSEPRELKGKMQAFWEQVSRLARLNRAILQSGPYLRVVSVNIPRLFAAQNPVRNVYGMLQDAVIRIRQQGLPAEYMAVFGQASEQYIRNNQDQIIQECEDADLLEHWPFASQSKHRKDVIAALDNKRIRNAQRGEFADRISHAKSVKDIRQYLDGMDEMTWRNLQSDPHLAQNLQSITQKLEREVCAPSKSATSHNLYRNMCCRLVTCFPSCKRQIFDYVIGSRYGGVCPLAELYRELKGQSVSRGEMDDCKKQMRDAVVQFFQTHRMSKVDKKEIRQERDFLESISLDAKELKRL